MRARGHSAFKGRRLLRAAPPRIGRVRRGLSLRTGAFLCARDLSAFRRSYAHAGPFRVRVRWFSRGLLLRLGRFLRTCRFRASGRARHEVLPGHGGYGWVACRLSIRL